MPDKESWVNILLMHIFLFSPPSAVTVHLVHVSIVFPNIILSNKALLSKWENNVNPSLSVISVTVRYVSGFVFTPIYLFMYFSLSANKPVRSCQT